MQLIDGNAIAASIIEDLTIEVGALIGEKKPVIAVIRVGEDPASVSYVRKKEKTAEKIGIGSRMHVLPESIRQEELFAGFGVENVHHFRFSRGFRWDLHRVVRDDIALGRRNF